MSRIAISQTKFTPIPACRVSTAVFPTLKGHKWPFCLRIKRHGFLKCNSFSFTAITGKTGDNFVVKTTTELASILYNFTFVWVCIRLQGDHLREWAECSRLWPPANQNAEFLADEEACGAGASVIFFWIQKVAFSILRCIFCYFHFLNHLFFTFSCNIIKFLS
jgi:hypothetical protein